MQNLVELVDVVATLEKGTTAEELSQDAANGPNVNCVVRACVRALVMANENMLADTCCIARDRKDILALV